MGPPSYLRSVVDRNVVKRRIPVLAYCMLHATYIRLTKTKTLDKGHALPLIRQDDSDCKVWT